MNGLVSRASDLIPHRQGSQTYQDMDLKRWIQGTSLKAGVGKNFEPTY